MTILSKMDDFNTNKFYNNKKIHLFLFVTIVALDFILLNECVGFFVLILFY